LGDLDVRFLDRLPGPGDTPLSLAQAVPLTGAVVVSTCKDVDLKITQRGLRRLEKANVPNPRDHREHEWLHLFPLRESRA
jgi:ATP-binding protein involved in chromosome partitioning